MMNYNLYKSTKEILFIASTKHIILLKTLYEIAEAIAVSIPFAVKGYRTYRLLYRDMPSDPAWYNDYGQGKSVVIFSVKFLEPNPALDTPTRPSSRWT